MGELAPQPDNLPALVQRAADRLASATTAAEVLEARDMANVAYGQAKIATRMAEAKGAHDELVAKAHRAQADALEIEAEAKRRLADEYDAAQDRGELATRGKPPILLDANNKPTAADVGLSHNAIHEARQIRDAEAASPGIVRETIDQALAAGREPTKAELRRALERRKRQRRPKAPAGAQLQALRKAWRAADPAVQDQFFIWLQHERGLEE